MVYTRSPLLDVFGCGLVGDARGLPVPCREVTRWVVDAKRYGFRSLKGCVRRRAGDGVDGFGVESYVSLGSYDDADLHALGALGALASSVHIHVAVVVVFCLATC